MTFDFETVVTRGPENLKRALTPREILDEGLVSFDGAEPDYPTAPAVREAAARLAQSGLFGFTLMDDRYREAVRWWMENSRGTEISPDWIVPTLGTIHALATAIRLLVGENEQMLVMPPVYGRFRQLFDRLCAPSSAPSDGPGAADRAVQPAQPPGAGLGDGGPDEYRAPGCPL